MKYMYSNTQKSVLKYFYYAVLLMMACTQNATKSFWCQKTILPSFSNMQESTKCVNNCVLLIDCINQGNFINNDGGY